MRAILSVYDKAGLAEFARGLVGLGFELYSTGGTHKALEETGIPARSISDLTGFPEILGGRVKTLHPAVHGGILARRDLPQHLAQLKESHIGLIDLVAVNLYPFVQTVSKSSVTQEEALENIDIGGPTMIRAAAKNFPQVLVAVDPADYGPLLAALREGQVSLPERKRLAQKAFQHVALYDTAISHYLRPKEELFPQEMTLGMKKLQTLRYGENPHQQAAFYAEERPGEEKSGLPAATQLWGKELSYNNILDADAAWNVATDFAPPTVAIIKHTNPCGLACHNDPTEAYRRALAGDPVAAFGGIVATNCPLNLATAQEIAQTFYEIILAPGYEEAALEVLRSKRDLRLLALTLSLTQGQGTPTTPEVKRVRGGFLLQTPDVYPEANLKLRTVTKREPTPKERQDLLFAWRAVKHVKSNAIVVAQDSALLGMGAGQPSRVESVEIALKKAGKGAQGSVLASDAFFPFPDGVELAARAGVAAVIQPGGSVRDEEVIKTADQYHIAMVFTGVRHFKH